MSIDYFILVNYFLKTVIKQILFLDIPISQYVWIEHKTPTCCFAIKKKGSFAHYFEHNINREFGANMDKLCNRWD